MRESGTRGAWNVRRGRKSLLVSFTSGFARRVHRQATRMATRGACGVAKGPAGTDGQDRRGALMRNRRPQAMSGREPAVGAHGPHPSKRPVKLRGAHRSSFTGACASLCARARRTLPLGDFVRLRHDRSVHAVTTFPRSRLPASVEFINKASMCARRDRGVRAVTEPCAL